MEIKHAGGRDMTNVNRMAEQHILEYESRQKHVGEILDQVRERTATGAEHSDLRAQLEELEQQQDRLTVRVDEFKLKNLENWQEEEIERSGLMGLWDALAQQAEKLAKRLDD
jgi:predicted mannosyl-3-phosphoglycerate phosphatase (HAD superfamily)